MTAPVEGRTALHTARAHVLPPLPIARMSKARVRKGVGLRRAARTFDNSRNANTQKRAANLKPLFAGECEPLCVRPRNVLPGFCAWPRIGPAVTRRCATQPDDLHGARLERSRATVASMFYALRAGLFGKRVRHCGGSSLKPGRAAGEKALPRLDELWTIQ
jgi:hypothetical protein